MLAHLIHHVSSLAGNSNGYNTYQIINLTAGMVIWTYLYVYLAYRGIKTKFVQMPLILACGNISWEFLWGFIFQSQYQTGVLIGMGSAFLIDLTIFYGILRYNAVHISIPFYAKNLKWLSAFGIALWLSVWWSFKTGGMDTDGGGMSGNILNAVIAIFWVDQLFRVKDISLMSVRMGWVKLLADVPIALFMMSVFPDKPLSYVITWISVLFDIIYIVLYYRRQNNEAPFGDASIAQTT